MAASLGQQHLFVIAPPHFTFAALPPQACNTTTLIKIITLD